MFATAGCSIKLWDAQNYTLHQEISSGRISALTWTQNGKCLASLGESALEVAVYAVNSKSTANIGVVRAVDSPSCLKFPRRSSHYLGVGSKDGTVALWSLKLKSAKKVFSVTESPISHIAFSHDDSHLAASSKGNLYLLSTVNNLVGGPFKIFDQPVTEVVYSMVKKSLLGCCSEGGSVSLFDGNTNKVLHSFTNVHTAPVSSVSFSPINELLMMSVGYDKKFVCYSIQTKKQILTHKTSAPLTSVALLPGCQHVALGAMTGEVFIHDLRTLRKPLSTLNAHSKAVTSILLQPAAKNLAEGASSDSKTANAKSKKEMESSKEVPSTSSSEMPSQEAPTESLARGKTEVATAPTVYPSQDIMSAIFSPVRPSEQASNTEGSSGELNARNTKSRKKVDSSKEVPSISSSEMPSQEAPTESVARGKIEVATAPTGYPSQDIMSAIFSPVRPSEQISISEGSSSESKIANAKSRKKADPSKEVPFTSTEITSLEAPSESVARGKPEIATAPTVYPSQDIMSVIFSPVRPSEQDSTAEGSPCESKTANDKSRKKVESSKEVPSTSSEMPPQETPTDSVTRGKPEVTNAPKLYPSQDIMSAMFSPVRSSEQASNGDCKLSKEKEITNDNAIMDSLFSPARSSGRTPNDGSSASPLNKMTLIRDIFSPVRTSQPEDAQRDFLDMQIGSAASHMQVELIRSCMAEVLEDFQDDVNRHLMHQQYIVTKKFLELQETLQQIQSRNSLTDDLLLKIEQLQKENARLRANF